MKSMSPMVPTNQQSFALCMVLPLLLVACAPGAADEAYRKGEEAFSAQDYAGAITQYTEAVTLDPASAGAYFGRGRTYWMTNQHAPAVEDLNRAIELQPGLTWAYFFRGSSLIALRDYEKGLADMEHVTASEVLTGPDLVRAYQWRGIALLNLERYEEALEMYTRCVELEPGSPFFHLERGRIYEALDRAEDAMADYRAVLELGASEDILTQEANTRLAKLSEGTL